MEQSPLPTQEEIDELIQFLPRLYAKGFTPIKKWHHGQNDDGSYVMPWPEYEPEVHKFFDLASKECWCDYEYVPKDASEMLEDEEFVENKASLSELKTMLTFCVRGERFCDGHRGAMIEKGRIRSILKRLIAIKEELSS